MVDENEEKEKHPIEMTTDEAVEFLFPPEAIEQLKAVAHESEKPLGDQPFDDDLNLQLDDNR